MNEAHVCQNEVKSDTCEIPTGTLKSKPDKPDTCLQCDEKKGQKLDKGCLEGCFKESDKLNADDADVSTDANCYKKCSKAIRNPSEKPSVVDPSVVAPSNNQTLGNNSTAAPKPNAPNSNNSTGADAAIHVGQTLSLARMIFTALAHVMAVKVIAA